MAERARTWSSCAAHSTNATVREALFQKSLAGNKCYRAGEQNTELDCQGELDWPEITVKAKKVTNAWWEGRTTEVNFVK